MTIPIPHYELNKSNPWTNQTKIPNRLNQSNKRPQKIKYKTSLIAQAH